MNFNVNDFKWTRETADYSITEDKIEIITKPHTDLWQRTYYHFRNDNGTCFTDGDRGAIFFVYCENNI